MACILCVGMFLVICCAAVNAGNPSCFDAPDDVKCDEDRRDSVWTTSNAAHSMNGAADDDAESCSGLDKPSVDGSEPRTWQEVSQRKVKVFSAFVERRRAAGGPAIRVVASGWQQQYNDIGLLFCQLWFEGDTEAVSVAAQYVLIYPSTIHHDMWVSHFILCPLTPEQVHSPPYAVAVSPSPCNKAGNLLRVLGRQAAEPRNTFALCLSPVYNNFKNWSMIIEMLELHIILGVDEIAIYELSASAETHKVLRHYNDDPKSKVEVINWPFPRHLKSNVFCQRGALNDCFYRMASRGHKFIALNDLDEVLVPRLTDSWPTLLSKIDQPEVGAFLFQHAYFRRNSSGDQPYLITQQSLWRTDEVTPPGKIRCKSMYKAELGVSVDLHFPFALTPGSREYTLPPEEGILHHYRFQPMESFRRHPENYRFIEDSHMRRYGSRLTDQYELVEDEILKMLVTTE